MIQPIDLLSKASESIHAAREAGRFLNSVCLHVTAEYRGTLLTGKDLLVIAPSGMSVLLLSWQRGAPSPSTRISSTPRGPCNFQETKPGCRAI
jgi:hypothetical protein